MFRIVFVVNAHEYTAGHRLPLLAGAEDQGYRVEAVAPAGSPAQERLEAAGYTVHGIGLSRRGARIWEEVGAIRALTRLYRRLQPALVHHATIKPVIYGSLAARRAGVPAVVNAITGLGYVYTGTDWRARLLRRVVDPLYRRAFRHPNQRVIFQNSDDQAELTGIGAVRPEDAVLIPGSGVDVGRFTPQPEPAGPPLVLLPARMLWDKGVGEFVAAARRLREAGVDARFALAGGLDEGNPSGIAEGQLRAWVEEGVVEWWGQVADMVDAYRQAHVVVLPSYREGLPKVVLEAAATGRPAITTDAPGCRDAVVDGETGYLVPPRDADALADRLGDLLQNADRRAAMGRAARERAEAVFSTERVVADTLAVYRVLLGEAAR